MSVKKTPQHLHDRLQQKTVKFDIYLLEKIPYLKIDMSFNSRDHEDKTIK